MKSVELNDIINTVLILRSDLVKKRLAATVLTACILLSNISSVVVYGETLQELLEKQNEELNVSKNQLSDAQKIVEEINSKIEEMDYEIENTLYEITEVQEKIKDIEISIENATMDIEKAENEMEAEKELYDSRMAALYINGNTGYLEILMGSENLSDLFKRIEIIRTITELDNEIIESLNEKKAEIEKSKQAMEKENSNFSLAMKNYTDKMDKLKLDQEEQQQYINEAKEQATAYANAVNEDKEAIEETEQLIEAARVKTPEYTPSRGSVDISSNALVAYASNFLGRPYVWGATGPSSFDCSGLTQYVMAHFGISIPRVSRDQAKAGSYVEKSDLQPGDLVFFAKAGKAVHHVGIYVGNNSYIHAPQTGDVVKISTLSSRSDYYTARRFN
ncbi:Cell wall-associated hydrolase, NlpC family [Clostridium grantii DSM 8605]|uniref:Cell wall-associated hydrolase, NlpC family n=1 Tax=Clostridium grantii DSM 8605 TaxID=1121316 RepID=A0A1M5QK54_9CLOT|nr:Cell wall-associated hydrolase, NlpC family [Clostridium grantii DSM 8605]